MPRALITGAAGFIGGGVLRRLLAQGWEVHALLGRTCRVEALDDVRDQIALHFHNGTTEEMHQILSVSRPDVVFHLASLFLVDHRPEDLEPLVVSNLLFPAQLAEAMVRVGCLRLINTGTSWQHYQSDDYRPVNLYAATKQAFEDLLAFYSDAHGMACTTLKLFDTYGPGDPRRKLINILLEAARSGESLAMSPGEQILELTHIDDVVGAFLAGAERLMVTPDPRSESFFVSGTRLSLRELVAEVAHATGRTLNVTFGGRPYRAREVMLPVQSSRQPLPGWAPKVDLRAGLAQVFAAQTV
jgi:nucleoside-diphosphate-sugar epimerase